MFPVRSVSFCDVQSLPTFCTTQTLYRSLNHTDLVFRLLFLCSGFATILSVILNDFLDLKQTVRRLL